jgi:glycosyltransferase involved in cell wall biosynthesis
MARLKERNLSAVCVGPDYEGRRAHLERLARELGVQVEFTGEVSRPEVNSLINRSRAGVVCAKRDGAPRIIFEYMAANVPSVVHAGLTAGARYIDERAGLLRAPEEFHLGIEEVLDHPDRFSPRAFLLQHYSREQVLSKFLGILEEAGFTLERGSPRTAQR